METLAEWTDRVARGLSHRRMAAELDETNTALSRWIRSGQIPASKVVDIARHYEADPLEGLAVAGYITEEELRHANSKASVRDASLVELTEELHRRAVEFRIVRQARDSGSLAPEPEDVLRPD